MSAVVRVKLSDFLSKIAPEDNFHMSIRSGCTVAECLEHLALRLGRDFRSALLDSQGRLHAGYAILLDKRFIPSTQLTEFTVEDHCDLSIVPIAGGGRGLDGAFTQVP